MMDRHIVAFFVKAEAITNSLNFKKCVLWEDGVGVLFILIRSFCHTFFFSFALFVICTFCHLYFLVCDGCYGDRETNDR